MSDAANLLKISRATLYNKVNKHPLQPEFIHLVKQNMSIDLDTYTLLDTKKPDQDDQAEVEVLKKEVDRLKSIIVDLQQELLQIYKKK